MSARFSTSITPLTGHTIYQVNNVFQRRQPPDCANGNTTTTIGGVWLLLRMDTRRMPLDGDLAGLPDKKCVHLPLIFICFILVRYGGTHHENC